MKQIFVDEEEFEALKRQAIPLMESEDTINDGIRKFIRKCLGLDTEKRTIEDVLNEIGASTHRYLAEDIIEEIKNRFDVKISLPGSEAWSKGGRWITFKKSEARGRKEVVGWIEPRRYGFLVRIYDPEREKDKIFRIGRDEGLKLPMLEPAEDMDLLVELSEDEIRKVPEYGSIKNKILDAFEKAYKSL